MKFRIIVLVAVFSGFGVGCQLTPTFSTAYQIEPVRLRAEPIPEKLAVASFEESRPDRYYAASGRLFLTYIPLLPYVTLPFERIEESVQIQSEAIEASGRGITMGARQNVAPAFETYYYPNSFAEAVAADLAEAGLFSAVDYVGREPVDGYRYVLRGILHGTELRASTTSYGLGMAGVLLWFLPIPMSKTTGTIDLELVLTDEATGKVVWQKRIEESIHRYVMLYTSSAMVYGRGGAFSFNLIPPPSDSKVDRRSLFSWHFEVLRRAMLDSKDEIAEALSN